LRGITEDEHRQLLSRVIQAAALRASKEAAGENLHPLFNAELARMSAHFGREEAVRRQDSDRVVRGIHEIIEAIKGGLRSATLAAELATLEDPSGISRSSFQQAPQPNPQIHPNVADIYRDKVANLHTALSADETRAEASDILRELI
jgi:hypothetical protein